MSPTATTAPGPGVSAAGLLAEIADIGLDPVRGGYTRRVFDPAEVELRAWFTAHAGTLGLDVRLDGCGNLWAWWGAPGPDAVVTGSHLDSVPGGGAFDGPLGVVSALAAVARLRAAGFVPSRPFAVAVFAEEEGSRFGVACLGSRLLTGAIPAARALALADADGVTLAEALTGAGLDPAHAGVDEVALARIGAFVELHVEQGRDLVDRGVAVAVATGILAHGRWRLRFTGAGNHAGTTPMTDRHDPVVAAAAAILAARHRGTAARGEASAAAAPRATVGRIEVVPGGTNVIASVAELWLDVRADGERAVREVVASIADDASDAATREGCVFELREESFAPQVTFDPVLRDRIARVLDGPPLIPTAAGHDAGILAGRVPTAMLFVRNPTGVSHAPDEFAGEEDCALGVDALVAVLTDLL